MSLAVAPVVLAAGVLLVLALRAGRRRLALATGVIAIALVAVLGSVHPGFVGGYRQVDADTIELQLLGARPIWRAVTQHTENASMVTVGIREIPALQLGAGFGDEAIGLVTIRLSQPLADRAVIDADTGLPIPRVQTSPEPSPSAIATQPSIEIACTPDSEAPAYLGDPCPEATAAVELAAAPVRLPIVRVVVEPGPFYCDDVWPGFGSDVPCYGPAVQPGQFMHAWVTFSGTTKVAAVMLGRDLPTDVGSQLPTPPPWTATLVKVEVPPEGWTLP
jgi:hypothetical protein